MASLAIRKIRTAKRSLVVVTGSAAHSAAAGEVHRWNRRSDLPSPKPAGYDCVAIAAIEFCDAMFGVVEILRVGRRPIGIARRAAELMARAARSDILATNLGTRAVALKTTVMGAQPRRN